MTDTPPPPPTPDSPREGTTISAGTNRDEQAGRTFPCEGCGADLFFHIGQQNLTCPYCGFHKQLIVDEEQAVEEQDFQAMLARLQDLQPADADAASAQKEIRCDACGGGVLFIGSLTSTECPYCGTPVQLEDVHDADDRIPVHGVLPFLVERKTAQQNLASWIKSRWFAPNEFLERGVQGKFNGIYLPFWTYDSLTDTHYTGQRGEHYYVTVGTGKNRRRKRRTRWYPASGQFQRFFDDVLVLAVREGLNRDLMLKLEPWPLHRCTPFQHDLLAGLAARTYEFDFEEGFPHARQRIDAALEADVRGRIGGDVQRVHSINTHYGALTFKHLLLPTWLMVYRYHETPYQVMINAATGEVQGERPYSWVKIMLAIIAAVAVIGGVFLAYQA